MMTRSQNVLSVSSMPKIWYGFSRGSEQDKTTTPALEARIPFTICINAGGAL
jgi:hypothetical protein